MQKSDKSKFTVMFGFTDELQTNPPEVIEMAMEQAKKESKNARLVKVTCEFEA